MVVREQQLLDRLATEPDVYLSIADADRHTDRAHLNNIPDQYCPLHQAYR